MTMCICVCSVCIIIDRHDVWGSHVVEHDYHTVVDGINGV